MDDQDIWQVELYQHSESILCISNAWKHHLMKTFSYACVPFLHMKRSFNAKVNLRGEVYFMWRKIANNNKNIYLSVLRL